MSDPHAIGAPDASGVESGQSPAQQETGKLELENKMLRAVLDSMADNISIKDLKGRYVFDNAAHAASSVRAGPPMSSARRSSIFFRRKSPQSSTPKICAYWSPANRSFAALIHPSTAWETESGCL